jgi:hypothetical protein
MPPIGFGHKTILRIIIIVALMATTTTIHAEGFQTLMMRFISEVATRQIDRHRLHSSSTTIGQRVAVGSRAGTQR